MWWDECNTKVTTARSLPAHRAGPWSQGVDGGSCVHQSIRCNISTSVLQNQFHYPSKTSIITSSIPCTFQGLSRYVYFISFIFYIFFLLTPTIKHCWYAETHYIHFLTRVLQHILNVKKKFKIKTFLHNSTHNGMLLSISETVQVAAKTMKAFVILLDEYRNMIKESIKKSVVQ